MAACSLWGSAVATSSAKSTSRCSNIGPFVRAVDAVLARAVPGGHRILVVDDNSPDGTGDWCDRKGEEDARVHCLHREGKLGLGTAIVAAMQYAVEHGYDYMLNMDADFILST